MKYFKILFLLLFFSISFSVQAQENDDKTLSPYFFVDSKDETDRLPLLHTEADVNIAGVIADVKVTQIYKNDGKNPIEAIYVFPASTRAAVYNMKMTIGKRIIQAEIQEKAKARATYEKAKAEGKSASLLEQKRPNVFQMNVANILPGDKIKVELFYTELLIPEEGIYEFVYPTVVGPRYSNTPKEAANADDKFVETPYTKSGKKPSYTFNINTTVRAGIPIQEIKSTSHKIDIKFEEKENVIIKLGKEEKFAGNKDYILQYQLKSKKIQNGMLLFEGEEENFFLMMMQPPKRIVSERIPPREYMFILDVSGSMRGHPMDVSKKLVTNLLQNLRPIDRFNILFFAGGSKVLSETSLEVNEANISKAIAMMKNTRGGGSTQLLPALKRALDMNQSNQYSRTFITVTDGYVTVEEKAFELIQKNLGKANFFTFGIGSSVNRHLIEGMARVGHGEPFIVTKREEADAKAEQLRRYIQTPLLHKINVAYEGLETYDVEPKFIPDLMAERPLIVFGKYKGNANGKITVSGKQGLNETFKESFSVTKANATAKNNALRYLWARHKIQILDDFNNVNRYGNREERNKEITNLGLKYNLLTKYTSFVAVDKRTRTGEKVETVKQPLPLPEGVENSAISDPSAYSMSDPKSYAPSDASRSQSSAPIMAKPMSPKLEKKLKAKRTAESEPEIEEVFTIVEEMPRFPGCEKNGGSIAEKQKCSEKKMLEFIYKNIKYPMEDRENGRIGLTVVSFVVDIDGTITDVKIVRSFSSAMDLEVMRVMALMPKWLPGKQRGKAVKVRYNLLMRIKIEP